MNLSRRPFQRGDVIAVGNRINPANRRDGCNVNVGVQTPWFSRGSYAIDLRADDDCVVRVNDIIDQSDASTTSQAHVAEPSPGPLAKLLKGVREWFMPSLSAAFGPKRLTGYTWMYGYGGTWDMLSEERGFHDFSCDGTYAFTNAAYGYCEPHSSTYWYLSGCWIVGFTYSGTDLYRLDEGIFIG